MGGAKEHLQVLLSPLPILSLRQQQKLLALMQRLSSAPPTAPNSPARQATSLTSGLQPPPNPGMH